MVETRLQKAQRMLRTTFGLGNDSPLELALTSASLMDVNLWMSLDQAQVVALKYDDNGTETNLKLGHYLILKVYQVFVMYHRAHSGDPSFDGSSSSPQQFDDFNGSNECVKLMSAMQPAQVMPTNPSAVVSTTQLELATFRKGIKRDASLYPAMTQDHQWDSWIN